MGPGRDRTRDPWIAVRHASVDRHVTDCATRPGPKRHHAYVQCVYIVSAKYQIAPSKAVVGFDRPIKALSMHIQKPYKGIIV